MMPPRDRRQHMPRANRSRASCRTFWRFHLSESHRCPLRHCGDFPLPQDVPLPIRPLFGLNSQVGRVGPTSTPSYETFAPRGPSATQPFEASLLRHRMTPRMVFVVIAGAAADVQDRSRRLIPSPSPITAERRASARKIYHCKFVKDVSSVILLTSRVAVVICFTPCSVVRHLGWITSRIWQSVRARCVL